MKKKLITICITLFIFFGSIVPVFAIDPVADTQVPYWLLDIRHQCFLSNNVADVTFGLAIYGDTSHYIVEVVGGGDFYLTYEVPAGETVYFRWAIARNNMGNTGASTYVKMSVDGSQKRNNTYNYTNLGDYGTYGSIVIVEDYTNTSNSKQLVTYVISNNGKNPTYDYAPILVGTDTLISKGSTEFDGNIDFTVDFTNIENKLDNLIDILENKNSTVPVDFMMAYSFFLYHLDFDFNDNYEKDENYLLPTLKNTGTNTQESYNEDKSFWIDKNKKMYLVVMYRDYGYSRPRLYTELGDIIYPNSTYLDNPIYRKFGAYSPVIFEYDLSVISRGQYASMWISTHALWNNVIPVYFGDGSNVTELISMYTGLPTTQDKHNLTIIDKLSQLVNIFNNGNQSIINNATNTNNQLSQSVNQYDNIEQQQVQDFTNNIANLPSFDFGSISDFNTTANFVSTQMQNIYNSSDYIKFMFTAVLTFGIALVLIGRGLRR